MFATFALSSVALKGGLRSIIRFVLISSLKYNVLNEYLPRRGKMLVEIKDE